MNDVLEGEISRHRIGRKLRQLRIRKSLSLAGLAAHTGLSAALLSKLETGKMVPTIPTLTRIALVFGVGLEHFFAGDRSACEVVHRDARIRLPLEASEPADTVRFECLDYPAKDKLLDAYLAVFEGGVAAAGLPEHQHDGVEFLYVMKGALELVHDGITHELKVGDSAYFKARMPHSYRRLSKTNCEVVVVIRE